MRRSRYYQRTSLKGTAKANRQYRYNRWRSKMLAKRKNMLNRLRNVRTGGYLGIEYKFFDKQVAASGITASWAGGEKDPAGTNCLFAPVKGTGPSDRDGDHVIIKQVQIRGTVWWGPMSDQTDVYDPIQLAIYLVLDTQTNGAQLNAEDVMVATDPEEFAFRNLQYKKRFKILKAWRFGLNQVVAMTDGANTASIGGNQRYFSCNNKCNIPVDFVGNAGTVADIGDNSLHIIACCSSVPGGVNISYHSRIRFVG